MASTPLLLQKQPATTTHPAPPCRKQCFRDDQGVKYLLQRSQRSPHWTYPIASQISPPSSAPDSWHTVLGSPIWNPSKKIGSNISAAWGQGQQPRLKSTWTIFKDPFKMANVDARRLPGNVLMDPLNGAYNNIQNECFTFQVFPSLLDLKGIGIRFGLREAKHSHVVFSSRSNVRGAHTFNSTTNPTCQIQWLHCLTGCREERTFHCSFFWIWEQWPCRIIGPRKKKLA